MQSNQKKKKALKYQDLTPTTAAGTSPILLTKPWVTKTARIVFFYLALLFWISHWIIYHKNYELKDSLANTFLWISDICVYISTRFILMAFVATLGGKDMLFMGLVSGSFLFCTFICRCGHEMVGLLFLPSDSYWLHDRISACITVVSCMVITVATSLLLEIVEPAFLLQFWNRIKERNKIKKKKNKNNKKK